MKISDLMQTDLVTIATDASLGEALTMLVDAHVLALPVLDTHGKFVGVLSTSDLLEALAERRDGDVGALLGDTRVEDLMTPQPQYVAPDDDVKKAAQEMLYLGIHRVFVVEGDILVGVLSQSDVVQAFANGKL
ncbi:MAG: CBS domain-containing protein [Gemmatimonadetes bacterium]|nr:MAG: CBS domain-containing protein [Gemmatimonadota bacterium]